jgi:hypothetical protein
MQYRWLVIRMKDAAVVGQFASRYAAMVFAERQGDLGYRVTGHAPAPTSGVHLLGSLEAADADPNEAVR